jgi:Ca2+-binding EF-hand superfamily protein
VLDPNVIIALINFKELSDMRKLFSEVLSYTLLPEQIKGLRDEFEKIDVDGDGEISLSALKQVLMKSASTRHLGALTEQEVEEIFNALRVGTKDPTIRWHEFIAAGLSQCEVDDRNLKLAFDRLDTGDKGYITFDDLVDLVGSDGTENREALELAWKDGVSQCIFCDRDQITYDDFVAIIKGQPSRTSITDLPTVDEAADLEEGGTPDIPSRPAYKKQRSRSWGERRSDKWINYDEEAMGLSRGILHAGREAAEVHGVIADSTMTPIAVNRSIYRAHREMRIAILEASKRFEEDRARRAEAKRIASGASNGHCPALRRKSRRPSLVMRRGSIPDPSIGSLTSASSSMTGGKSSQELLDEASERGGRPSRERRRKTVSDMTGMLYGSSTLSLKSSQEEITVH